MAQQTAVELFAKELIDEGIYIPFGMYDKAKQMEKEQIINAYYYDPNTDDVKDDGEQYYNETYKP